MRVEIELTLYQPRIIPESAISPGVLEVKGQAEMAESTNPPDSSEDAPSTNVANVSLSHQSKSGSESFLEFGALEGAGEGKNSVFLVCRYCKCKVLRPGYGTLVEREVRIARKRYSTVARACVCDSPPSLLPLFSPSPPAALPTQHDRQVQHWVRAIRGRADPALASGGHVPL